MKIVPEAVWDSIADWDGPEQRWHTEAVGCQGTGEVLITYSTSLEIQEIADDRKH